MTLFEDNQARWARAADLDDDRLHRQFLVEREYISSGTKWTTADLHWYDSLANELRRRGCDIDNEPALMHWLAVTP
jgi:hypothetical protein